MVDQNQSALIGMEQQLKNFNKNIVFIGYHYNVMNKMGFNTINDQAFINFWYNLINKINKVKRINNSTKSKNDPYDQ